MMYYANTILTPISGVLVSDEMTKPETLPVVPEKKEIRQYKK